MTVKEQLHELVDRIAEDVDTLQEAIDYLRWLASDELEELSPEEWVRVRKGEDELARGETFKWNEVKRDLGL